MGKSWASMTLRVAGMLPLLLTAACSSGGGGGSGASAGVPATLPATLSPPNVDSATTGANSPVFAADTTTLAGMAVGTVLPLRQAIITTQVNSVLPQPKLEAGGATLTYQGIQTVGGVTGPAFELKVPTIVDGIDVTLKPDGTGGSNADYARINGKVDLLNYTMTAMWSADESDIFTPLFGMGVTGFQTPGTGVPASGQGAYLGNGAAGAKGSVQGLIFTSPSGTYNPPATVSGSSSFSVTFATGQVTGTLSGLKATPVSVAGVAGTPQDWNQINITGTLSGAVLAGSTSTSSQPSGSLGFGTGATGKIDGALYGPNGEELGAVWSLRDPANSNTALGVVSATKQ